MGRMVVTPGGSPHWVDEGRRYRRHERYGRMKNGEDRVLEDPKKEKEIRSEVEDALIDKFYDSDKYTDEQKDKIKNTIKAQAKTFSKAILKQAEEDIEIDENSITEGMEDEEISKMFYRKLKDKALSLAEEKYFISSNFDIERAIRTEREVLEKINNGELTRSQAKDLLGRPMLFESRDGRHSQFLQEILEERLNNEGLER